MARLDDPLWNETFFKALVFLCKSQKVESIKSVQEHLNLSRTATSKALNKLVRIGLLNKPKLEKVENHIL